MTITNFGLLIQLQVIARDNTFHENDDNEMLNLPALMVYAGGAPVRDDR